MNIVEQIYKDSNMSIFTLEALLDDLKTRDNKITGDVENLKKGYERYLKEAEKILKKENGEKKKIGFFEKKMAKEGVKKEVKEDNSDASIAEMLIKGISMSTLEMEKLLKKEEKCDQKILELAHDFMAFGKDNMTSLKNYF